MPEGVTTTTGSRKPAPGGSAGAETRSAILDATIDIMRDEGYAAVSSRRIASRAGLKSKLVHYYFRNMDDLFLAVYKRIEDQHFHELTKVLSSSKPLRAMWRLNMDCTNTNMVLELTALARHRKNLRDEIARSSERFLTLQAALLERASEASASSRLSMPPMVLAVVGLALTRLLAVDNVVGVSTGREETLRWAEGFIDHIEDGKPLPG